MRDRFGYVTLAMLAVVGIGLHGCGDDDGGRSGVASAPTNPPAATATRTVGVATATATRSSAPGTATPSPTVTPPSLAGRYSASIALDNDRVANLSFQAGDDGQASGTLEILGPAAALSRSALGSVYARAAASISLGFATVSGSFDPATGAFHFSGNIGIAGVSTSFDLRGNVPLTASGSGTVTAIVGGQTYTSTIGAGAGPTPLPTQPEAPTPTPVTGCGSGVFGLTFADAVATNADTSPVSLGNASAFDTPDSVAGRYVWVISANPCSPPLGSVARSFVIQGAGITAPIEPGTYTIGASDRGILSVSYTETKVTLDPNERFLHTWAAKSGTVILESAGGSSLRLRIQNAAMDPGLVLRGAEGTFTLNADGVLTSVM